MNMFKILDVIKLQLFAENTNVTTDSGLSDENKTFYEDTLIDMAEPELVHDQFAQKRDIPKGKGKTIEFRKYSPLPKALTPLTEGVTPDGQKLNMSTITATVSQYGGYVALSDILDLTAIDNNLVEATKLLASQAGRTLDTITREELVGGTNVLFGGGVSARHLLSSTAATPAFLTIDDIRRAVRTLKVMNAQKIKGYFCAVIHPDAAYDIKNDPLWTSVKAYSDPDDIYEGEIGRIEGVRFVESSEAKVFHADNLTAAARNLTVKTNVSASTSVAVKEAISSAEATALAGRKVIIAGNVHTIASASAASAGSASITLSAAATLSADAVIYPGEAGAAGRDVYATLVIADNAYGTTELTGGGLQHIVKQLGSAGTADPLDQRATVGWKATKVAKRLVEEYLVRIETVSTFEAGAN